MLDNLRKNKEGDSQIFPNISLGDKFEDKIKKIREKGEKRGKRKKLYSITGIILLALFAGFIIFAAFYFWEGVAQIFNINFSTDKTMPVEWRMCEENFDCVETQADCCNCNNGGIQTAINKEYLSKWENNLKGRCSDIGCITLFNCKEGEAVCENKRCKFKEKVEESEIDVSNWKTYRNEEVGIEFKHPAECTLREGDDVSAEKIAVLDCNFQEQFASGRIPQNAKFFGMINMFSGSATSVEDHFKKSINDCIELGATPIEAENTIRIQKLGNLRVVFNESGCGTGVGEPSILDVFNPGNKKYIGFLGNIKYDFRIKNENGFDNIEGGRDVIEQLYKTFKFIDQDETADWKTYRNEELGFEFKYPNNWFLDEGNNLSPWKIEYYDIGSNNAPIYFGFGSADFQIKHCQRSSTDSVLVVDTLNFKRYDFVTCGRYAIATGNSILFVSPEIVINGNKTNIFFQWEEKPAHYPPKENLPENKAEDFIEIIKTFNFIDQDETAERAE